MNATQVYSLLAYNTAIGGMRYGAGIAVAMTMAPIMAIFIVILGRYMMSGRRLYAESEQREWSGPMAVVLNAVAGHHGDIPADNPYTPLIASADAISASRPGATEPTEAQYPQ